MIKLKHYLVAVAATFILTLLACIPASAAEIQPAGQCYPADFVSQEMSRVWRDGHNMGRYQGQIEGQKHAVEKVLEYWKDKCSTSGTEVTLPNGITLVCK